MDDQLIIERIKKGDSEAFAILVERYHKPLLSFIYRLVSDEKIVEDLGQEVFLDIYRSLKGFDEHRGTPFSAWLFIMARNRCISELRKRTGTASVSLEAISDRGAELKSAEDLLIEHERRQTVRTFLQRLSEPFRRPLVMSMRGYSLQEIAVTCGISAGTAKSRLNRAKQKLRLLVKESFGGKGYERI
jgi:RNA polymerase sigma-70 factor (ECF subfamily)